MPGKSRRKRGKYSIQSKRQGGLARPNIVQQPTAAKVLETTPISSESASPRVVPASPRVVPAPKTRVSATMMKSAAIRYSHVPTELRTIGILAGLMLILLIVLARVLS